MGQGVHRPKSMQCLQGICWMVWANDELRVLNGWQHVGTHMVYRLQLQAPHGVAWPGQMACCQINKGFVVLPVVQAAVCTAD